jgi:hypothetical protein
MMKEYENRLAVGTCRGLLYCMRRKNGETKKTEVVEPVSNEYEATMMTKRRVQ